MAAYGLEAGFKVSAGTGSEYSIHRHSLALGLGCNGGNGSDLIAASSS
jgi:hypothetical protein